MKDLFLLNARAATDADGWTTQAKTHKEVAQALGISPATVRKHLQTIYTKLQTSDKAQLVAQIQGL